MEITEELKELAMPIIDFLKEKRYSCPTVVISPERILLTTDETNIPILCYEADQDDASNKIESSP